jgi:hypothetical protein
MGCPDYYRLADWDGRELWEFLRDECLPMVGRLEDGEKHALLSACEHLFRRGLKGKEDDDLTKYRWWLNNLLSGYQPDRSDESAAEYRDRLEREIAPVLALVEMRRMQKLNQWASLGPMTPQDVPCFVYESVDDAS